MLFLSCSIVTSPVPLRAQTQSTLPIMPLPAHVVPGQGEFVIDGTFGVSLEGYKEPRLERARQRFLVTLSHETGIPLWRAAQYNQPHFTIKTDHASQPVQQLGEDESYDLEISSTQVLLTAANPLGVLHGLQTFLQLVRITPQGFSVPAVTIHDHPRFPWRGLMIDSSRHFIPIPVIERDLDGMEAVKLNVFHWHISDDQGFRAESRVFPLLQNKGSDGLYYTQTQIHQVLDYARDRGIRVVPEFDMPCHTASWLVGYPQLASSKGPYHVAIHMGVHDAAMDPTKESTYQFLNSFIGEMAGLFPDAYFHIGGDECNGKEWNNNPQIQQYMHAHGIADNAALQAYFTARVQKLVAIHHKIMEGWDEVLQPTTPKNVVIQSWRGQTSLAQAARQGNRGILSTGYYIDLNQPASQHYLVDPLGGDAASLDSEQRARILGGEATIWSEFVTPENIDSRIWPRTAAIAERLWSPQEVRDVDSMYQRLAVISQNLKWYGINPQAVTDEMLQRMTGNPDPATLKVLAAVVQPPIGYTRDDGPNYTSFTPLNRLVDAVPPESDVARQFQDLVEKIVAGHATEQQWAQARQWLILWRDNDAKLQPALGESNLTQELVPVSHNLSAVAIIGLQSLDNLRNHTEVSALVQQKNLQQIKAAEQQTASLLNMVAPSVKLLVQATKTE
ncbi:MAG: family 20 glycosylhydrolase [Acidobacteria bacterium]|nr:family 20 glycosylhydrolase [Acidobacteriota bacterium]MBW4044121.1 family 20 glycosylhydrolase [Acidobacteriota bacterium]